MRLAALFLLPAMLAGPAFAADDLSKWSAYAPKGWRIIDAVEGKLGTPLIDSAVLIAEKDDATQRIKNDGLGTDPLNLNPRHLLILEKGKAGYVRKGHSAEFLPSEGSTESPCLADPLDEGGIAIAHGVLTIRLHYWLSCGSWSVSNATFYFRAEKGRHRLIGYDRASFARNGGTGEEISINYLSGRKKLTTGIAVFEAEPGETAPKQKVVWKRVGVQRYYLDTMDRRACDDFERAPSWCGY
jgi:hypothetical protein